MFGFDEWIMISYVPSNGKAVQVLSTTPYDAVIGGCDHKPEIILHYIKKNSAVNSTSHLATNFSCKWQNNR